MLIMKFVSSHFFFRIVAYDVTIWYNIIEKERILQLANY